MTNRESSIVNDLAIRIANLEIEKAGLSADLKQAQAELAELKKQIEKDAE